MNVYQLSAYFYFLLFINSKENIVFESNFQNCVLRSLESENQDFSGWFVHECLVSM